MGLEMSTEVRPIRKSAIAVLAGEGFLPRVSPDVSLEEPWSRERLPTQVAFARQSMSPNVHLEGTQRNVNFFAELANELLLVLTGAVELDVLGQAREGGV